MDTQELEHLETASVSKISVTFTKIFFMMFVIRSCSVLVFLRVSFSRFLNKLTSSDGPSDRASAFGAVDSSLIPGWIKLIT